MERYLKVAGAGAGVAVVVALFAGLLGGVGLGAVMVRSLMAALVFAPGALGITIFAERFLPELMDPLDSTAGSRPEEGREHPSGERDESPSPGSTLNIVVEDEGGSSDGETDREEREAFSSDSSATEGASAGETRPSGGDDLVEEVEEQGDSGEHDLPGSSGDGVDGDDQNDRSSRIDNSDLDEMPDIGSFAGSFVSPGDDGEEQGEEGFSDGPSPARGEGSSSRGSDGHDAAQIAKALRTMIARDE